MGKRKQKTRWCSLDISLDVDGQGEHQAWTVSPECSAGVVLGSAVPGSGGGTRRSSLAPRFERKAAAEAEKKHFYYEGEFCEAEDLPNGFTKIRSKNLDILFKRDYYEQRLAAHLILAEQVKTSEHSITAAVLEVEEGKGAVEEEITPPTTEIVDNMAEPDTAVKSCSRSFDHIDPNDIEEFKPMNSGLVSQSSDIDSAHTSPFYPPHPQYPDTHEHEASPHPLLYLYSPTDNSLIPCEEIIIPNPAMYPEGPVYSGPTNIYLAYPVQGPDGKGYITQPFATPGSFSAGYSPYDGSNYYSSTSQDSGSSTQPTSPPPLATYHPNNWINQDQPSLMHHFSGNIEGLYDPQPILRPTDKSSPASSTTVPGSAASSTTATYIPGLCLDSKRLNRKKSQKKRKKKRVNSGLELPSSSSSESEILKLEALDKNDETGPEEVMEILVPEVNAEPIQEVYLTDDLADSLVNPPTDPELSEEESFSLSATDQSVKNSENNMDVEKENEIVGEKRMSTKEFIEIEDEVGVSGLKENEEAIVQVAISMAIKEEAIVQVAISIAIKDNTKIFNDGTKENIADIQEEMSESGGHEEKLEQSVIEKVDQGVIINPEVVAKKSLEVEEPKSKVRNRKPKRDVNLVLKPEIDSQVMESEDKSKASQAMIKKSYSSVIKSSLVKESNNNGLIPSQTKIESVPTSSPLPTISNWQAVQSNTVQDSDNWEKVATKSLKPENKRKPSRKRRTKNQIMFEDSLMEDVPELETVPQLDKCSKPMEVTEQILHEADPETDNLADDIEIEKRKLRKKKKFGSKEVSSTSQRVIICDDQISIRYSQAVRGASEVLSTSLLDTVRSSGYCDFLVIRELGSGISRGCMDYDRLYQGKYIPPERTDGLPAWCGEESVKGERSDEEVTGENSSVTASADIDLD